MGEYSKSAIIRYTRIAIGMTQEELSETVCDPVTLSRYESGKIDPSDEKFQRLMKRMGESGNIYLFPIKGSTEEIDCLMTSLLYAIERREWDTVDKIKKSIIKNHNFRLDYPENRQFIKRIEIILKYNRGEIDVITSINELREAWRYTSKNYKPEDFPISTILRETEILILFNLATFYKIARKYQSALILYKRLDTYFCRKDMNNDYKPIYLIYVGYSNLLGEMGCHEESIQICFKAINKLLMNNQANYLYNFYYNIGWNILKIKEIDSKINTQRMQEAKLYVWLAYQLCEKYPEDRSNLNKIKELYQLLN